MLLLATRFTHHFQPSTPVNVSAHAVPRRPVAFTSANVLCVCTSSGTTLGDSGMTSTHSGLSRKPFTCTPAGTIPCT